MGASRETINIWFWIKKGWIFRKGEFRRIIKSSYFWQDSFLTYFNRIIGCKLFGHHKIHNVDNGNGERILFCFSCYRKV